MAHGRGRIRFQARTDFDRRVLEELTRHDMGPSYLLHLLTLVDWRLFRRDQAMLLGLPDYFREDLVRVRSLLESYSLSDDTLADSGWEQDYRGQIARSQAKYEELERQAGDNVGLSEVTSLRSTGSTPKGCCTGSKRWTRRSGGLDPWALTSFSSLSVPTSRHSNSPGC